MRPFLAAAAGSLLLLAAAAAPSFAQAPGDSAATATQALRIGERAVVSLTVSAPAGATVEVDPSAESWAGVEVVRVTALAPEVQGATTLHRFEVVVAPFLPGLRSFAPSVAILAADGAAIRELPAITWEVFPTLPEGAPLEISPLPGPTSVAGAESPLLRPALGLAALAAVALLAAIIVLSTRLVRARLAGREPEAAPVEAAPVGLASVESLIDSDPVAAYRSLAVIVRGVIAMRFDLPATALTTRELRTRMESSGTDRFLARLVGGFLEECDSVVYAGYRPASARRHAHLNMAREIVEAAT